VLRPARVRRLAELALTRRQQRLPRRSAAGGCRGMPLSYAALFSGPQRRGGPGV